MKRFIWTFEFSESEDHSSWFFEEIEDELPIEKYNDMKKHYTVELPNTNHLYESFLDYMTHQTESYYEVPIKVVEVWADPNHSYIYHISTAPQPYKYVMVVFEV